MVDWKTFFPGQKDLALYPGPVLPCRTDGSSLNIDYFGKATLGVSGLRVMFEVNGVDVVAMVPDVGMTANADVVVVVVVDVVVVVFRELVEDQIRG